jgi:uncharacterized membrane protein
MPFCCQCGSRVNDTDVFCAKCGNRHAVPPPPSGEYFSTVQPRTAAILCYVPFLGWIASIVVLASDRFRKNRTTRFHAFQGLYLFVAWLIVDHVLSPLLNFGGGDRMHLGSLLRAGMLGVWIFMLVKASQEELFSLPIIGELAERSIAEQK